MPTFEPITPGVHTCGLWLDLQFGMRSPGLIVTTLPLMLVTSTNCCWFLQVGPSQFRPGAPPCSEYVVESLTKKFPVSAESLIWSKTRSVPTDRSDVPSSVICVVPTEYPLVQL